PPLPHFMYARCVCPACMHPHVCWMVSRACCTTAASEHFLLTQVASAGLIAADASNRPRAPTSNRLIGPHLFLAGRQTSRSGTSRNSPPEDCQGYLHANGPGSLVAAVRIAPRTTAPRTGRSIDARSEDHRRDR